MFEALFFGGDVMAGLQVSCPKCSKSLKLPDRSLLGRKGKCPKCRHAFVLTETPAAEELSETKELDQDPLDVSELYDLSQTTRSANPTPVVRTRQSHPRAPAQTHQGASQTA